jgi:hypothetical protein
MNMRFNILELETWELASNAVILWNNKELKNKDGIPLTENDVVNLFTAIFGFLEKNGKLLTSENKINGIKTVLNRMINSQDDKSIFSEYDENDESQIKEIFEKLQTKIIQNEKENLKEMIKKGSEIEFRIIQNYKERENDIPISKLSENCADTNILIDHINDSKAFDCISETDLTSLFCFKLTQFIALAEENNLPIQEMRSFYDKIECLTEKGISEERAWDKNSDLHDIIFSKQNYNKFDKIIDTLNRDVISVPSSEVFRLDRLCVLTDETKMISTASYLKNEILKFCFCDPNPYFTKDYEAIFPEITRKLWTENDTKLLKSICQNYSPSEKAASFFFNCLFSEDGRLNEIKKMITHDTAFDYFLSYLVHKNKILHGGVIKECKHSGLLYLEKIHISKLTQFNLYCPYYKMYNNNKTTPTEALKKILDFSAIIGKCPNINELDNPYPDIRDTKRLIDIWVTMPHSHYYKQTFGSLKSAYKLAKA